MEDRESRVAELPAEAWRLHARVYLDSEKAEFGPAEGRTCPPDQWHRSNHLYPGCGAQSAGTLDRAHPRRPCERSSRRPVSRGAWSARYGWCGQPQAEPVEVRRKAA